MGGNRSSKVDASHSVGENGSNYSNNVHSRHGAVIEPERPVALAAPGEKRYRIFGRSGQMGVKISMHNGNYLSLHGPPGVLGASSDAPWILQIEEFIVLEASNILFCCRIFSTDQSQILSYDLQRGREVAFKTGRPFQITGDNIATSGQCFIRKDFGHKTTLRAFPEEQCWQLYYNEQGNSLALGQRDNCDDVENLPKHFLFDIILHRALYFHKVNNMIVFEKGRENTKSTKDFEKGNERKKKTARTSCFPVG